MMCFFCNAFAILTRGVVDAFARCHQKGHLLSLRGPSRRASSCKQNQDNVVSMHYCQQIEWYANISQRHWWNCFQSSVEAC